MRCLALAFAFIVAGSAAAQSTDPGQGGVGAPPVARPPSPPDKDRPNAPQGCADPSFNGKYSNELRRLNIPADLARYGRCRDYGAWPGNSYAGHTNLPHGFWVYSYPYWIIFAKRGP